MSKIVEISESLWLDLEEVATPEYDDGLFYIRDDTGGNTLINRAEIPRLIQALQSVQVEER